MVRAATAILLAMLFFSPLAWVLYRGLAPAPEDLQRLVAQFALPGDSFPEPHERAVFLAGAVLLPSMIFLGIGLAEWRSRRGRTPSTRTSAAFLGLWELCLAGLAIGLCAWGAGGDEFVLLQHNLLYERPVLTLPLFALGAMILTGRWVFSRSARWLAIGTMASALGGLFLGSLFNSAHPYAVFNHFAAVFEPMVQVHFGKVLLVDYGSQYGLWPHFLQPVFWLTGLGVTRFTAVIGLLLVVAMGAVGVFLLRLLRNHIVGLLGFVTILVVGWLWFVAHDWDPAMRPFDRYLQYMPLRLLFPALLLPLAQRYFERPTRCRYWCCHLLMAAGVLWNVDSGVPAAAAWVAALIFQTTARPGDWPHRVGRLLVHPLSMAASLGAALLGYALFAWALSGQLPKYLEFLAYQRTFYGSGLGMLPAPLPGTWLVVVLVYMAGFGYAAEAFARQRVDTRATLILLVSVLGVGLLAYYQGRSHVQTLRLACWPSLVLMAIFLDDLCVSWRTTGARILAPAMGLLLMWIFLGTVSSGPWYLCRVTPWVARDVARLGSRQPSSVAEEIRLIREKAQTGQELIVVSSNGDCTLGSLVHAGSGLASAFDLPLVQMLLVEDFRKLARMLEQRTNVLVFRETRTRSWAGQFPGFRELYATLDRHYRLVGTTSRGDLLAHK